MLVVLPVDVAEQRGQFLEHAHGYRTAPHEGARFSAGQDLALDQQFAVFDFKPGGFQQAADGGLVAHVENARHARPRFPRAHHLRRRAAAQQQAQCIHHDGFAAARLSCQQI